MQKSKTFRITGATSFFPYKAQLLILFKIMKNLAKISFFAFMATFTFAACESNNTERAAENTGDAVERDLENAGEEIEENLEEAADETKEAARKAGAKLEEAGDEIKEGAQKARADIKEEVNEAKRD